MGSGRWSLVRDCGGADGPFSPAASVCSTRAGGLAGTHHGAGLAIGACPLSRSCDRPRPSAAHGVDGDWPAENLFTRRIVEFARCDGTRHIARTRTGSPATPRPLGPLVGNPGAGYLLVVSAGAVHSSANPFTRRRMLRCAG